LDGGSARRKTATYTGQYKYRINAHNTDIHAFSGIRTHDFNVRANEDSSCLRPRDNCDRQGQLYFTFLLSETIPFIQGIRPGPRLLVVFRNKLIFYGEEVWIGLIWLRIGTSGGLL
jgi:hypothetical protein